jgi:hypothetical protein
MTLSVPTAAFVSAQAGTSQQTLPLPAGPLALQGGVSANASGAFGSCSADVIWSASQPGSLELFLTASASVANSPGQASVGPVDILVSVTAASSVPVAFALTRNIVGSPGTTMPFARVDVGDDGIFELDEMSPSPASVTTMVGPIPLIIRCRIGADAAVPGVVSSSLHVSGRPANTLVSPMLSGCSDVYSVAPRFDGNLEFWIYANTAAASLAVFGLATQPQLLGSVPLSAGGPLMPCLLMPRPDFIVYLPTLQPQLLVIPPAARPIVLYSQCVYVLPVAHPAALFSTSATWQINAY